VPVRARRPLLCKSWAIDANRSSNVPAGLRHSWRVDTCRGLPVRLTLDEGSKETTARLYPDQREASGDHSRAGSQGAALKPGDEVVSSRTAEVVSCSSGTSTWSSVTQASSAASGSRASSTACVTSGASRPGRVSPHRVPRPRGCTSRRRGGGCCRASARRAADARLGICRDRRRAVPTRR